MTEREIFTAALHQESPAERAAYLDAACGNDAALRERVESLLAEHEQLGSFMEVSAPDATVDSPAIEPIGTQIGSYKLLQKIGEGGFGVVYMAEQVEPVRRRVALKVIKPGMDTRQVIGRFEAERQALAVMDHPHIARVLDGGTTASGRPYFVMELVRGTPITEYCDENSLSIRQRLELFASVCQAIQHAHTKGIIHRDIKPTNVLVTRQDGQAVVKVIDFGIAKAIGQRLTDKTVFTDFAQMIGTPLYMSPEQAELSGTDIDTRSDVYSLGVLLYELLTGSTPVSKEQLKRAAFDEIRRIIREEEPQKPSTRVSSAESAPSIAAQRHTEPARLTKLIRGELDWIVMKALEKDRNRRYETANGFALDIQRYLHDEPVQACPPSTLYRFRKFARRNKGALAAAAATLFVLVIAAVGSSLAAGRFRALAEHNAKLVRDKDDALQKAISAEGKAAAARDREQGLREEAERLATIAERQRDRANASLARARRAVDEYLSRVTDEELLSVPGLQPLRQELLAAALRFYSEFTQEQGDDPALKVELASAHYRLGRIHSELGNSAATVTANNEAIRILAPLAQDPQAGEEVLAILAAAYYWANRHDEAIQLCQRALAANPGAAPVRRTLADTYAALAKNADNIKDYAVALQYHQQAFEIRDKLVQQHPDDAGYNAELAATLNNIGVLLNRQGKTADQLKMYQRALGYHEKACRLAPHSILWGRWLATTSRNIGLSERSRGNAQAALTAFERQADVWRRLVFQNPAVTYLRGGHYKALLELAEQQEQMGLMPEANHTRRDAREVLAQLPQKRPAELFELATVYAALATPPDSNEEAGKEDPEAAYDRERHTVLAMQMLQQAVDAGWADVAALKNHRTLDSLRERKDFQTLASVVESVATARQVAAGQSPRDADALATQQKAAEQIGKLAAQPGNAGHRKLQATMLHSIGLIQSELKQFEEAEKSLQEALAIREQLRADDSPQTKLDALATQYSLGQLYWNSERHAEAHRLWQQVLAALEAFSAEHKADAVLQASVVDIEGNICEHYGRIGLWSLAAEHAVRNVRYHRPTNILWDAQFASLLTRSPEDYRQYCQAVFEHMQPRADSRPAWELAQLAWLLGQGEDAGLASLDEPVRYARKARELDPNPSWFVHALALIQYRAGRHADAAATLDQDQPSAHLGGSGTRYLWALAYLPKDEQVARRHFEEAERMYRESLARAVASDPLALPADLQWNYPNYWWHLVHTQTLRAEALRAFHGADAPTDDPWQHLIQARGYRLIGETERSNEELSMAVASADDKLLVRTLCARMYEQFGQTAEAAAEWRYVLAHAPGAGPEWIARHPYFAKLLAASASVQGAKGSDPAPPAAAQPPLAVVPFSAEEAVRLQQAWADHWGVPVAIENSLGMKFRLIPPGVFDMGTPPEQLEKLSPAMKAANPSAILERARLEEHNVCVFLTAPFYLGECEVTVGQFRQFVAETGYQSDGEKSGLGGYALYQGKWQRHANHIWKSPAEGWPLADDQPVVHISWNDTKAFCEWLRNKEFVPYTVPTEAQWEFACRAGSSAVYGVSDDPKSLELVAWTKDSGVTFAQPVGSKLPNAFGLFDMLGNAYEWTSDNYAPGRREERPLVNPRQLPTFNGKVIRGLPWYQPADINRVAQRNRRDDHDPHDCGQGFRLAIVGNLSSGLSGALRPQDKQELADLEKKQTAVRLAAQEAAARQEKLQSATARRLRGWTLIESKQFAEAEQEFLASLKQVPDSADGYYGLGKALEHQKQFAAAESAFRASVSIRPEANEPRDALGWSLIAQQKYREAEAVYRDLILAAPDYVPAPLGLAKVFLDQKRFAEAEVEIRGALLLNPKRPHTHEMLGTVLREQKKFTEAEAAYLEAIDLMPESAPAHRGLGMALNNQKRFAEAIGPLQQAIRLSPNDNLAHNTLGFALLELRRFPEAEASLRVLIRLLPEDAGAYYGLGKALFEQRKLDEAEQSLRKSLRLDPTRTNAHGFLGFIYIRQEKLSQAEAAFREQACLSPEVATGFYGLGKVFNLQNKFAAAEEVLREAVHLDRNNADAYDLLGWALLKQQKPAEAEAAFRELVRLAPKKVHALSALGRSLVDQEKFVEAEGPVREALQLDPEHQLSLGLLKRLLVGQGKDEEAKAIQLTD
jgi:tetratricopeptide (TPR) repeat protein/serine/threonine protein kinase